MAKRIYIEITARTMALFTNHYPDERIEFITIPQYANGKIRVRFMNVLYSIRFDTSKEYEMLYNIAAQYRENRYSKSYNSDYMYRERTQNINKFRCR